MVACGENKSEENNITESQSKVNQEQNITDLDFIFPKGEKGPAEYFTGMVWLVWTLHTPPW